MTYDHQRALALLRLGTQNPAAVFRDGQDKAIRHVVEGRGRLLVVQRTGWGKSSVYFIAAKLLREQGVGPTLLVSPLLALMRNQIEAAKRMGVRAATINSDNRDTWGSVEAELARNEIDVLLISPERFGNERFMTEVLAPIAGRIALLVIDEAHCISDWGHDFRPHYRLIERILRTLPANLRLLATTATANNRVVEDLRSVLGPQLTVSRGELGRPSLYLQTMRLPDQAERLAWLAQVLPTLPGSGIIYTLTVRDAALVTDWLRLQDLAVESYTGETGERRPQIEQALLENKFKALVATTALGMGFDKPDLAFVIHFQAPGSVVAYYQQVGRAGRAISAAYGVLLSGTEDTEITDYFIKSAFPTRAEVEQVLKALETTDAGLSNKEMQTVVNASQGRIDKALLLLSLESPAPVVKEGSKWKRAIAAVPPAFWERAERLTALRSTEQRQMQDYVALPSGHMEFLLNALDGGAQYCRPPALQPLRMDVDPSLVQKAVAFLRRTSLPLEPRERWPVGGLPLLQEKGAIPVDRRAENGKVLCMWGDAGWGAAVKKGKYTDKHFSDALVTACVGLLREWAPAPTPAWVTCIPSRRHPDLVPDFARRLAEGLSLPFHPVLQKTDDRPPQKEMANSAQQARNVDGSLVVAGTMPAGPVLLVDDMVDSRWTLTVAAWLLRAHGSGPVFPLALASTAHTD